MSSTWINTHLKISACPLSQVVIEFESKIIKRFDKTVRRFVDGAIFKLIINFRECYPGEYYDKEKNYCKICPNHTFSFDVKEDC